MSSLTRRRIINVCMVVILVICAAVAVSLITKPKLKKLTSSVDEIIINRGSRAADVTTKEKIEDINDYLNKSTLTDLPGDANITFNDNSINCEFRSKGKEVLYVTITGNEEFPYVVKANGKNYAITKVNTPFNSLIKEYVY
ncbi:MAG: hypothetical protein K5656_03740 [Lachnospiraceae bacterium]|nr:hypothetical protein [Lachnospiraceae bacterium]